MAASRKRHTILLALAAVIVALFLVGKWWQGPEGLAEARHRRAPGPQANEADAKRRSASPRPASVKREDRATETPEAIHFRNFYLRPASLGGPTPSSLQILQANGAVHMTERPNSFTLTQAITWVKVEYAAVAEETGHPALPLSINLGAANTSLPLNLNLPRLPVTTALGMIAAATGNRLEGTGPDFALVAMPDGPANGTFEWQEGLLGTASLAIPEKRPFTPEDFAADGTCLMTLRADLNTSPSEGPPPDLVRTLRNLGFPLSDGLSVHPSENSPLGHTTVDHATASDLAILRSATEALQSGLVTAQQSKLTTSYIELPDSVDASTFATGNLDAAAYETLMSRVDSTKGAARTVLPSVMARYGQSATIDIRGDASTGFDLKYDLAFSFVSRPLGLGSEDTFDFQQTSSGAPEDSPVTPHLQITGQSTALNGKSNVSLGTTADGRHVLLIRTTQRIDATGRPIDLATDP